MRREIKIREKIISESSKPFIVAEAGVNYFDIGEKNGIDALEAAKLMISQAAKAGADAIKFQTYKAGKLVVSDAPAYWDRSEEPSTSQYELFQKYDKLGEQEYRELAKYAEENNIVFMSTPFDEEAVNMLTDLVPVFKIASADITSIPFIRHIARKKKPVFLSTGASTLEEISEAVEAIKSEGNTLIVLLHCVLNYPTQYQDANLNMIKSLRSTFPDLLVGYSDHTRPDAGMLVLLSAYLLGAVVIEKHFTLDKSLPGNDHYHAMDPEDLQRIRKNLEFVSLLLSTGKRERDTESLARKHARRSLVSSVVIPKGTIITADMVTYKRPGTGIPPKFIDTIIGRKAKCDIENDKVITWEMV